MFFKPQFLYFLPLEITSSLILANHLTPYYLSGRNISSVHLLPVGLTEVISLLSDFASFTVKWGANLQDNLFLSVKVVTNKYMIIVCTIPS